MKHNSILIGFFAVVLLRLAVTCAFLGTALYRAKNPAEPESTEEMPADTGDENTDPADTDEPEPAETESAETESAETKPDETEPAETKPAETGPTFSETLPTEPERVPENNGDTWNLLLVNLWNKVDEDFTVSLSYFPSGHAVDSRAFSDLEDMLADAKAEGLSPIICSSYRSVEKQQSLYDNQVNKYLAKGYTQDQAEKEAAKWVAIPGTSEHQTGLAVDIVALDYQLLDENQENTAEQQWLMENSYLYGWILRYPTEKSDLTGISYEPWHYRYVGKDAAKEIYDAGVCLEEYLMPAN